MPRRVQLFRRPLLTLEDVSRQPDTLVVFDFDHTLVYTPTPEEGKPAFQHATGQPWPYPGWWGEVASLLPPLAWHPIAQVIGAFHKARREPRTRVVVVTGRPARPGLLDRVKSILKAAGVAVDPGRDLFLKPVRLETLSWKLRLVQNLLTQMPRVKKLVIWDDRGEHLKSFKTHDFGVHNLDVVTHHVR